MNPGVIPVISSTCRFRTGASGGASGRGGASSIFVIHFRVSHWPMNPVQSSIVVCSVPLPTPNAASRSPSAAARTCTRAAPGGRAMRWPCGTIAGATVNRTPPSSTTAGSISMAGRRPAASKMGHVPVAMATGIDRGCATRTGAAASFTAKV